ncbi:polysaccharide deacetylase family protein [Ectobacillus sp. sgz5001026]|uniref:polysaccharide deacetylase family protein n=1 Tax=Ectobacillus sp. sgz5001026 TaxID=3242473 RepID=UPI0036D2D450
MYLYIQPYIKLLKGDEQLEMKRAFVIFTFLLSIFFAIPSASAYHVYPGDLSKNRITYSPLTFDSTSATVSIKNPTGNWKEISYFIWRTADGTSNKKSISSSDRSNQFSLVFDTKDFMNKRGEYTIEAYGTKQEGTPILLGQDTITFSHEIPILMYHAIDDYHGVGIKDLFVSPAQFEKQMQYLKENGYTLLTFEQWNKRFEVNKPIFVTFDDGMKNNKNAFIVLTKLKDSSFTPKATAYVIADTVGSSWLSHDEIKEMVNSGIFSIQSHTLSHADLPTLPNPEAELKGAKEQIESITGKPVIALSYPFGHVNDKVVEVAKKYYKFATTTKPGYFEERGKPNELLLQQRIRIHHSTTMEQFAALLKDR